MKSPFVEREKAERETAKKEKSGIQFRDSSLRGLWDVEAEDKDLEVINGTSTTRWGS